ncbi:MAG: DUF692 family multinuclear iron-containing protein [Archangium sp.]
MKLGVGVGLRSKHYGEFLNGSPRVDWVEAITENFLGLGGRPLAVLEKVRRERPVVLHGVSLGIASVEPPPESYLRSWKQLVERIEPAFVSDHLCWGRAHGRYAHDLLPFPFTEASLRHVVERIARVQDFLGRQLVLENVSSYVTFPSSEMSEWEFVAEVAQRADCKLLLDVNNVFVSAHNHGFDAVTYLNAMPVDRIAQFHLAGHSRQGALYIDTHEGQVSDEVLALYAHALHRFGPDVPTLIEWDEGVPSLEVLLSEADRIRTVTPSPCEAGRGSGRGASAPRVQLIELQSSLFEAITNASPIDEATRALTTGHLEVYAEMYWLRLRDVLRATFPACHSALGDEAFDLAVAALLKKGPSTSPSIDAIGEHLAAELASPWNDVAALEWARAQSFTAPDAPTVDFAALQSHDASEWPSLELHAHPSLRTLSLSTDPRPALRNEPPVPTPTHLITWRSGFEVFHAAISPEEHAALTRMGATLPELLEPFGDDAATAFETLQSWFAEGLVSSVTRAPPRS